MKTQMTALSFRIYRAFTRKVHIGKVSLSF